MLLGASILSSIVIGYFGYRSGTDALESSALARVQDVRNERAQAVKDYIQGIEDAALLDSQGVGVDASAAFNAAYAKLAKEKISPAQGAALSAYYSKVFVPRLAKNSGDEGLDPGAFVPTSPERRYVQASYTAKFTDFDKSILLDDAGDGSDWSKANKRFNPYFRTVCQSLGYEDALIMNLDGTVVYSAYKGADLGSNIKRGEFRGGQLERAFDAAVRSNSRDYVAFSDFEQYQPSYDAPTGFVASPIGTASEITGVLVYQVPIERINQVMTGGPMAGVQGLGKSGETYLVGKDEGDTLSMRSNSRELVENPARFRADVIEQGVAPDVADRMVRTKSSVLLMPAQSRAATLANAGRTGTMSNTDYLGHKVLSAYAPLKVDGVRWAIVAKVDASEALAPVRTFARNLLLATAVMILLVAAASMAMARVFTRPLNRLVTGVRAVAAGNLGTRVEAPSKDEFGDLAHAFNDMSRSLETKQMLLDEQLRENERILLSMMPAPVVKRYRGGEQDISEEHKNVSVVFTDIVGFDDFAGDRPAAEALAMLNSLSRGFDEAAKHHGIEKVRSAGTGYVATSGLVAQRVDHTRRVVDFALEVQDMVNRFNLTNSAELTLRAGVGTGDVRSGLVGRTDVVYDLWGEAVNLAYRVQDAGGGTGIFVTNQIYERLSEAYTFESAGAISTSSGDRPVWRLVPGADA